MDRAHVWPDFRSEHVLYEDDDIIGVHKPAGVASQAARPDVPDDLVTRLRAFLAERAGKASGGGHVTTPYLGVHQRLDQATSGVVIFTKRKEANAAVARAFEGRAVKKRYLAAVRNWRGGAGPTKLEDFVSRGPDGIMRVVPRTRSRGPSDAVRAVTHVRVRAKKADRALLELDLETGRTHQARVQLAHAGAAIAGDALYGGAPASRLMLHAASLEMAHPRTTARLSVKDPDSAELDAWLARGDLGARIYDDEVLLDRAIANAFESRWGLGRSDGMSRPTTAFRVIHEDGDALPGLAVDVYGDHLVAQLHLSEIWDDLARRERVLDRLATLGFDGIYLKLRPRQANVLVDTRREDVAPKEPVRGARAPDEITVYEEGAPLHARLGDGLSTGIFLDQRGNRSLVRAISSGARVLNLFSYTCAFSVVAALGGAIRTVSVDASVVALERGRANFELAGVLGAGDHAFVAEDVFSWLARAAKKPERFDVIIVDPPSYSSTKKRRFVAASDYGELVAMALAVAAPGAKLVACCNHRGVTKMKLRRMVRDGAQAAGKKLVQAKDLPDSPDFPPPQAEEPHMKSVLGTLR